LDDGIKYEFSNREYNGQQNHRYSAKADVRITFVSTPNFFEKRGIKKKSESKKILVQFLIV
jgi:hypothetical protein